MPRRGKGEGGDGIEHNTSKAVPQQHPPDMRSECPQCALVPCRSIDLPRVRLYAVSKSPWQPEADDQPLREAQEQNSVRVCTWIPLELERRRLV